MSGSDRILFTGAAGQLGRYLEKSLRDHGFEATGTTSATMNITDPAQVSSVMREIRPTVVIHGAAWTDVDGCEREPERADLANHLGAKHVADAAREAGAWLIGVGTDFVFSGDGGAPYAEDAEVDPISEYGASKLRGEQAILHTDPGFAVARTSWVFGGAGKHFPRTVLNVVQSRGGMSVVNDEISCPTFAGDLAEALVQTIALRPSGVLHLSNEGSVDRYAFARDVVQVAGGNPETVTPTTTAEFLKLYPLPARRPGNSTLANVRARELGIQLPNWQDAVRRYIPVLVRELDS